MTQKPTIDKRWEEIEEEFEDEILEESIGCPNCGDHFSLTSSLENGEKVMKLILSFFKSKFSLLEQELSKEIRGEVHKMAKDLRTLHRADYHGGVAEKHNNAVLKLLNFGTKLQSLKRKP